MMNSPTFSIIVPVYNVEKYLSQCIESILAQTFSDFELLLIDDGSSDGSPRICDHFAQKDARVKVFHQENGGVSSARNFGIEIATGQYISFVDADDWIEPEYCQRVLEKIHDSDLLFFTAIHHFEDGSKTLCTPCEAYCTSRGEIEKEILALKRNVRKYNHFGFTWNKIFRRSIIIEHNIRFPLGLSIKEDEIFTEIYSRYITSLRVTSLCIYNYRVINYGLTKGKKTSGGFLQLAQLFEENIPFLTNNELISAQQCIVVHCRLRAATLSGFFDSLKQFGCTYSYQQKIQNKDFLGKVERCLFRFPLILSVLLFWGYRFYKKDDDRSF